MTDFVTSAELITRLYTGELGFELAKEMVRDERVSATPDLADRLWAASTVLGGEGNPLYDEWQDLREEVQLKQLGVTRDEVTKITQQYGPRYNKMEQNGWLITASFDPSSIPSEGDSYFKGLQAKSSGELVLYFEQKPNLPPLIFPQDIDVAMIFAFHPSRLPLPYLSLEGLDEDFPDRPNWLFIKKDWHPRWMSHTLMGETLYAADYWIGRLAWQSKQFATTPDDIPDDDTRARVINLLRDFELCGGSADGYSSRVMLKPGDVYGSWNKTTDGDIVCDVHRIDMGVDGSDMAIKIDPTTGEMVQDRAVNLNNPRFAMGRAALLLTSRYNEIAEFFPMFERSRQLIGLLKTLVTLREKYDFKPDAETMKRIDEAYQYYTKQPSLKLTQRLCSHLKPRVP
ncbi:MAG: hypothetical protein WAO98_00165 [Alphaproteobacteria bacterium]